MAYQQGLPITLFVESGVCMDSVFAASWSKVLRRW